jgi:putative thioredoxin
MSQNITEATAETFQRDVIEASRSQPVLVDFWADWCGPCKMLAPVLEQLATDYSGQARIVKVNTDTEMELAQAHGIRSLPTMRVFRHGKAVDELIGLQPDGAIRAAIERFLERPSDAGRAEAARLVSAGKPGQAVPLLEAILREEPDNTDARVELIDALARAGQADAATLQFEALPVQALDAPRLRAIEGRLLLARAVSGRPDLEALRKALEQDPSDLGTACALAAREFEAGHHEQALERWLGVLRRDRNFGDGLARRCLLAALDLMEDQEEMAHQYRRKLMALLH